MNTNKFMRSVRLKESACRGCINCIKHCPTQLYRLRQMHFLLSSSCKDPGL